MRNDAASRGNSIGSRNRPIAVAAVIAFIVAMLAAYPEGMAGEAAGIRCRWRNPENNAQLDMTFAGNPILIALPGDALDVTAESDASIVIMKDGQPYREDRSFVLTAPDKPGSYFIPVVVSAAAERREAEICVLVPYKATARKTAQGLEVAADGQDIGHYRHPSRSGNVKVRENPDSYQPPVWWFRVTDMNAGFEVTPGLTAGELVVPTEDTGLKHTDMVPVRYGKWQAINTLRAALPDLGIPADALKLISMFRSPPYNRAVGSNAFGRHIYGDAFDFYIDIEGDGKASDLNKDGKLDRRDAYPLVSLVEDLMADGRIPMGGIGVYNTVGGDHVVTMHVDQRGHRATWGYVYPASGKRRDFSWASKRFADIDRRDEDKAAARAAKEGKKYHRPNREPLQ